MSGMYSGEGSGPPTAGGGGYSRDGGDGGSGNRSGGGGRVGGGSYGGDSQGRGDGYQGGGGGGGGSGSGSGRDGDWSCPIPNCGNLNFARTYKCSKCGAPSPSGSSDNRGSEGAGDALVDTPAKVKRCDENCDDTCDNSKVCLSNLPPDVTVEELTQLFEGQGGSIKRKRGSGIQIYTDEKGKFKGDVCVACENSYAAHNAARNCHNSKIRGYNITVVMAEKSAPGPGPVSSPGAENIESPLKEDDTSWETFDNFMKALKEFPNDSQLEGAIGKVFQTLPPVAMEAEKTEMCTNVPHAPESMMCIMSDVGKWAMTTKHCARLISHCVPPIFHARGTSIDETVQKIFMISAEFQVPTPLVQRRKLQFYRFVKEFTSMWMIFDISTEFFKHSSVDSTGWRRQSVVIVSKYSPKVFWLERMQGPALGSESLKGAFSADRWLKILSWCFRRCRSRLTIDKLNVNDHRSILYVADSIKRSFLFHVLGPPDDRFWVTLANHQNVKVMRRKSWEGRDHKRYICVKSLKVESNTFNLYNFLSDKLIELQWSWIVQDQLLNLESYGNSVKVFKTCNAENEEQFIVQENSGDGYMYSTVASVVGRKQLDDIIFLNKRERLTISPRGFTLIPDGPTSTIVTIVAGKLMRCHKEENAVEPMMTWVNSMAEIICREI